MVVTFAQAMSAREEYSVEPSFPEEPRFQLKLKAVFCPQIVSYNETRHIPVLQGKNTSCLFFFFYCFDSFNWSYNGS